MKDIKRMGREGDLAPVPWGAADSTLSGATLRTWPALYGGTKHEFA